MPSNLTNLGISFNPLYTIRQQFKGDMLLNSKVLDIKTADEVKQNMQFNEIADLGPFLKKTTRHQRVQDAEWEQLSYSGRRLTWETYYKPLRVDKEWEITQAAVDNPFSAINQLIAGVVRTEIYRAVFAAAAGSVMTGSPQSAGVAVTAANDGVITIDGTAGWTRAKFNSIFETLLAQKFHISDIREGCAFISPTMNTAYLSLDQVINRLYNSYNSSAVVTEKILDTIPVEVVPGDTATVEWVAANEILPVNEQTRYGVVLMPDAIAAVIEDMEMYVNDNPTENGYYVDERIIICRYRMGTMRKLGQRVLLLSETMPA